MTITLFVELKHKKNIGHLFIQNMDTWFIMKSEYTQNNIINRMYSFKVSAFRTLRLNCVHFG